MGEGRGAMTFMLVLQWRGRLLTLDRLMEVEDLIDARLTTASVEADCDGHDIGPRECNIFILTNDPEAVLGVVHPVIRAANEEAGFAAAYRKIDGNTYRVLWPTTQQTFDVT